jgi:predicted Holliday junction resolvase-like endonuclease
MFGAASVIYKFAYSTAPVGRGEIINLVFYWCVLLFWLRMLVITVADSVRRRLEQKEQEALAKLREAEQHLAEAKERQNEVQELKAKSDKLTRKSLV